MSHMPGWYQTSNALQSTAIGEFAMYRALDKFDALLRRLARTSTVFSEVEEVYLDSCIEIKSIPRNGFMAYYKETRGECNESISTALASFCLETGPGLYLQGFHAQSAV